MPDIGRAPSLEAAPDTRIPGTNGLSTKHVSQIQRTRILAAMAEICVERGMSNVTVAHVVSRSGVSRRTFYEIFDDREDCFLATLDEALARAASYVLPAYETPARWDERMRASLIALLSFLRDEPFMGQLMLIEALAAGPVALERRRQVLAGVLVAVDEGRALAEEGKELPALTAEGLVGGALSVLHARLVESDRTSLLELTGPLMGMIVLPYLGAQAAKKELKRPVPVGKSRHVPNSADLLRDVDMRLTYRTVRVLMSVAAYPGSSNREIGTASDVQDQGQISKLLTRLHKLGLIENMGAGIVRGAPNAWVLTGKGQEIEQAVGESGA
ncbi:MAG TPA: TetR family transcriptional regulator [Solirubrobacteraceae bacterium]|jgi:AcrR family transcriptional regulator|nr:TetR family transcriptional regulator [Solirubrobacteraceae bacterium]